MSKVISKAAPLKPHAKHSLAYYDDVDELIKNTSTMGEWEANRVMFGNTNIAIRKQLSILLTQLGFQKVFDSKRRYCLTAGHPRVANEDNLGQLNNPTVLALTEVIFELCKKAKVEIK